jgi:hypothetical protein
MNNLDSTKTFVQGVSTSLLKAFVFVLFPLAVVGQIILIVSKFSEGVTAAGAFNLPNWVVILCSTLTVGIMIYPMALGWKELESRKKQRSI